MGTDPKKAKKKKEKKEGAKERKKTPWKTRQMMRVDRGFKSLTKLASVLTAAKAPGIDATLASNALSAVSTLKAQVNMLANDWKPERGHQPPTKNKLGIGSVLQVKTDLDRAEVKMFKHISADLFTNATILEDLGRDWLVKCVDGVTRVLLKKLAQKAGPSADVITPIAPINVA